MKTLFALFFLLVSITACGGGSGSVPTVTVVPERLEFTGTGDLGFFDPSVILDPATNRLWMSYSSVDISPLYASSVYWAVSIRLAYSDDNGVTWQDFGEVAPAEEHPVLGPMNPVPPIPANSPGIWQSETSALIYDPLPRVEAERWKLIWFQYLHANQTSYFADYSWISLKMAATPSGLASATPVKLFGGAGLQADSVITAAPVYAPIGGLPEIQLNSGLSLTLGGADLSELNLCVFAEPGLHATNLAIYLAIFCADAITNPITEYLVYFRCISPCDMISATGWEYLGRLLTPADASAATGDDHFQAPALVEKNARTYLVATPVDTTTGNRYNGCRVYEFTDVDTNLLRRNSGQLVEMARVDGDPGTHNGACAASPMLDGGLLLSQFEVMATPETFKVYKSQVGLP
jgi:hypothetical protein